MADEPRGRDQPSLVFGLILAFGLPLVIIFLITIFIVVFDSVEGWLAH